MLHFLRLTHNQGREDCLVIPLNAEAQKQSPHENNRSIESQIG